MRLQKLNRRQVRYVMLVSGDDFVPLTKEPTETASERHDRLWKLLMDTPLSFIGEVFKPNDNTNTDKRRNTDELLGKTKEVSW